MSLSPRTATRIQRGEGERAGHFFICLFLGLFAFTTIYPVWHVIMYSLSDSKQAMSGGFFFWPRGFSLLSYEMVFKTSQIWIAYRNSILVMAVGTVISVLLSAVTAYPLSRKRLRGRNFFSMVIFFTMLFSGGMIPLYLQVSRLGLLNTFWSMILPISMSAYNMFILRNFMQGIPYEIEEAASIDGASHVKKLFAIIAPLSLPSIATITLFCAVDYWNSYFNALIYIDDKNTAVLQIYLRELLMSIQQAEMNGIVDELANNNANDAIRGAAVFACTIPIILVYPFLQKYYVKGVTLGAVKG